jgi:hypothetical protein
MFNTGYKRVLCRTFNQTSPSAETQNLIRIPGELKVEVTTLESNENCISPNIAEYSACLALARVTVWRKQFS